MCMCDEVCVEEETGEEGRGHPSHNPLVPVNLDSTLGSDSEEVRLCIGVLWTLAQRSTYAEFTLLIPCDNAVVVMAENWY